MKENSPVETDDDYDDDGIDTSSPEELNRDPDPTRDAKKTGTAAGSPEEPVLLANSGGNNIGNGGSGFLCEQEDGSAKVLLRDFYEAERLWNLLVDLDLEKAENRARLAEGDSQAWTENWQKKLHLLLVRWFEVDPVRGREALSLFQRFLEGQLATMEPNLHLPATFDVHPIADKPDCKKVTIALQKPPTADEAFIQIDTALFALMEDDGKAGLVAHELIYHLLLRSGAEDSYSIRELTSLLAADAFAKARNAFEYFRFLDHYQYSFTIETPQRMLLTEVSPSSERGFALTAHLQADQEMMFQAGTRVRSKEGSRVHFGKLIATTLDATVGPRLRFSDVEIILLSTDLVLTRDCLFHGDGSQVDFDVSGHLLGLEWGSEMQWACD